MISIAICEDNEIQRDILSDYLNAYSEKKQLEIITNAFSTAEALIESVKKGHSYDIYILDIILAGDGMNGIELASALRYMNDNAAIVFATSSNVHAIQAFDVEAMSYLLKPIEPGKLYKVLDRCISYMKNGGDSEIVIKTEDGNTIKLKSEEVSYVNVHNRRPVYHVRNGEIKSGQAMRFPFKDVVSPLLSTGMFCTGGSSIAINLSYIDSIDSETVMLKNGDVVYPPKSAISEIKNEWKNYKKT